MDLEMQERIERMAFRTWVVIGRDILTDMGERDGDLPAADKDTVIEAVCDADYMETYGKDEEAFTFWNNLPTTEAKMEAVTGAFPLATYGW